VEQWLGVRLMLSNERQHDMLPQHLVCKYQLNCEYFKFSKELSSLMMI